MCTVEPRYKEVLGMTNVFVSPVTVKTVTVTVTVTVRTSKKTRPRYSEHIFPVP